MSRTVAIIVAAGNSSRMGKGSDKLFAALSGEPVLLYSLRAFQAAESIDEMVVVTRPENVGKIRELSELNGISKVSCVVEGSATRASSVLMGLEAIGHYADSCYAAIHDGARPLVTPALIDRVVGAAKTGEAAIPVVPVRDTVKVCIKSEEMSLGYVCETPKRDSLFLAQTPQVFRLETYRKAVKKHYDPLLTDDSALIERAGFLVMTVEGEYRNIKITTPEDLKIAEILM